MIKLINCSDRDTSMYYQGTILFDTSTGKYVHCQEINNRHAAVYDESGAIYIVDPSVLRVHLPTVQYTLEGRLIGIHCQRSYKRGYQHDGNTIDALTSLNNPESGVIKTPDGVYVAGLFYVKSVRNVPILHYKGEICGLFQDDVFYLRDSVLAGRLAELVGGEYEIVVQ